MATKAKPKRKAPPKKKAVAHTARGKRRKVWVGRFLESLRDQGAVTEACQVTGIGRRTAYDQRERDPAFAGAWDEIVNTQLDNIEDAVVKRAREGWLEPVWHEGKRVGTKRKFSDTLQIFVLRQRRPNRWAQAEKLKLEHDGEIGIHSTMTDEDRLRQLASLVVSARTRKLKGGRKLSRNGRNGETGG